MTYKVSSGTLNLCSLTHSFVLIRFLFFDCYEHCCFWPLTPLMSKVLLECLIVELNMWDMDYYDQWFRHLSVSLSVMWVAVQKWLNGSTSYLGVETPGDSRYTPSPHSEGEGFQCSICQITNQGCVHARLLGHPCMRDLCPVLSWFS